MKRKDIYLTERQIKLLEKDARKLGVSVSEIIRRIIDLYFEKEMDAKSA